METKHRYNEGAQVTSERGDTVYLLKSKRNAERLAAAQASSERGEGITMTLDELHEHVRALTTRLQNESEDERLHDDRPL